MSKFEYNKDVVKKKSVKSVEIPLDIYRCKVIILMPKEARIVSKDWDRASCGGETIDYLAKHNEVLILLHSKDIAIVTHELLHAVQMIMQRIGHNTRGIDEPSAYLLTYLIEEYKKKNKLYNNN